MAELNKSDIQKKYLNSSKIYIGTVGGIPLAWMLGEKRVVIPSTKKGFKNKQGDYVVTTINIPDMRDGLKAEKAAK